MIDSALVVAGIDGGGTKTECAIIDRTGACLSIGRGGPSNILYNPLTTVIASYNDAIDDALSNAEIRIQRISVTGCTHRAAELPEVRELISSRLGGNIRTYCEGEAALGCAGIFERNGIVQIAGTGSSTFGIDPDGKCVLIGGWGMLLGDEGGACDIALKGLRAAVRSMDGTGPQTMLLDLACNHFRITCERESFIKLATSAKRHDLASFAVVITNAANKNDQAALDIVNTAIEELAHSAIVMASRYYSSENSFPVVLHGGVFNDAYISSETTRQIKEKFPKANIILSKYSPGLGLALFTLHDISRESR